MTQNDEVRKEMTTEKLIRISFLATLLSLSYSHNLSYSLHLCIYIGGHKSESTPIFVSHLEILSYLQNFYELEHVH